jgi:hypothetical protein
MADPPRPPPVPSRVQDVAREYARDVLPAGPHAPASAPHSPAHPSAAARAREAASELAKELAPAARRVKELARDLAPAAQRAAATARDAARDLAGDLAHVYRRSSRTVRLRAAVVATWAALSLASVWIALPSSGPSNDLGAEAKLGESFLGTQLLVRNESDLLWTDVVLTLDGGWRHERRTVRPGDEVVVAIAQFKKDGKPAPKDLRPSSVLIECGAGRARASLAPR